MGQIFGTLFGAKRANDHTACLARFDELADKVARGERQVRALELEWESTYNKLRAIVARLNKRAEREEAHDEAVATPENGSALARVAAVSRRVSREASPADSVLTTRRNY